METFPQARVLPDMKKISFGLVLFLALLITASAGAAAPPGSLDPGFGHGGRIVRATDLGGQPWSVARTQTATLPDGRFVLLAGNSLYGFLANGAIVRAFGAGEGPVPVPAGYELEATGIAADASGRVVVVGTLRAADGAERALVVRYTAAGDLDPAFGDRGVLVTDFGLPPRRDPEGSPPLTQVQVAGVAVDSQDRIVLSGTRTRMVGPCRASSNLVYADAFAARLDAAGRLDSSFGDKGIARMFEVARVGSPVLDSGDGVYVTTPYGGRGPCTEPHYDRLVGHLDAAGRPDTGFGEGGWISLPFPRRTVAVTTVLGPDDTLLLVESRWAKRPARKVVKVRRLLSDGALDDRFGRNGAATISAPSRTLEAAAAAVDSAGRILVTGTAANLRKPKQRRFFLGRLTASGRPDRSFGRGGLTITGWGKGAEAVGGSVLLQPGRAVVAGTASSRIFSNGSGLVLAGYRLGP
jgi:uncharacterized delta-60 repeat protein